MRATDLALACMLVLLDMFNQSAYADMYFDPGLLSPVNGSKTIDDATLLAQGAQPPGEYSVHIFVNGEPAMVSSVRFELDENNKLYPCLGFSAFRKLGVDMSKIKSKSDDNDTTKGCVAMQEYFPDASVKFDFANLKLDIKLPQTVLLDEAQEGVPQEEWDDGVPALITSYQVSGQQQFSQRDQGNQAYANLTNGFNLGAWRFRNTSTLDSDKGWETLTNYVETVIKPLKAELTLGDATTPGDIFDSLLLRGVQLGSDTDMIPDQQNGFAPVIHGIAKSNARVTIKDKGYVIWQRSVPQGPFTITDLAPISDGGQLDVTITEADGSESHFSVNYASVPQLLRNGQVQFNLAAGKYIDDNSAVNDLPQVAQATISWGLPLDITLYGGAQFSDIHSAFSAGVGADLQAAGALALDITQAKIDQPLVMNGSTETSEQGKMIRLTWHDSLGDWGTNIQLSNRWYMDNYLSLKDALSAEWLSDHSLKHRETDFNINQTLNDSNNFYFSLNETEYRDNNISRNAQLSWNTSFDLFNLSLAFSMNRQSIQNEWDKQLSITFTVPFAELYPESRPSLSYTTSSNLKNSLSNQLGMNGAFSNNQSLNWNTQLSYNTQQGQDSSQSASAGLDYQGKYGQLGGTFISDTSQYLSWNASGTLVAHRHGITAGPYSNGALAIVSVPDVADLPFENGQNSSTDGSGNVLIPNIRHYRRNAIRVDTRKADKSVEFQSTSVSLVPTRDAVVAASLEPRVGRKVVATVSYRDGFPPFGAIAKVNKEKETFFMGDQGQVYLTAVPEKGVIHVQWGDNQHCDAPFALPPVDRQKALPVTLISMSCQ